MFIIYRCIKDSDGDLIYNKNSMIGIYDDYTKVKNDLMQKINKMKKDDYEIECDDGEYFFVSVVINDTKIVCYEVKKKEFMLNKLKFR